MCVSSGGAGLCHQEEGPQKCRGGTTVGSLGSTSMWRPQVEPLGTPVC